MAPRTEEQNEALREESRSTIIRHALALFAQHGYERTSVRMIAQAAGVSQGLMYNYFSSKEELLQAIFERSMRDVRESFAAAETGDPAQPPLERFIRASFAIVRHNIDFWRLSYGVRGQPAVLAHLQEAIRSWTASIRQVLEGYLREAGFRDPAIEAEILFALIDGTAQHYVLEPERYPLDAVIERIVVMYTRPICTT